MVTVEPQTLPITWQFVGQLEGYKTIEIRPRVNGILLKRAYTEGSFVKKGQLLFKIDPTQYEADVRQAQGVVAQKKAALDQARRTLARVKPLYKTGAVSGQRYDDSVSKVQIAEANLEASKAALKQQQINLGYTTITAPISGLSQKSNFSVGSLVRASQSTPLTTIIETDPIYVYFSFADNDYLKLMKAINTGQIAPPKDDKYQVTLALGDGSKYTRTGKLDFKNNVVSPTTGTIQLRAIFPNPDGQLVPNQFVRVVLKGAVRPHAILVPQRAVLENAKGQFVFVVNAKNQAAIKPVKAGSWEGTDWLIEKGLAAGDRVVTDGFMRLKPGMTVKITSDVPSNVSSSGKAATATASR